MVGPIAQRFGEWASASRTFAITDLISVVQRDVDRLCSFSSPWMHAPPPPTRLLRLLLTAATFSPSRHHHRTCVDRPPSRPTLRRRVGVNTGLLVLQYRHLLAPVLCCMTITPLQFACSGTIPVLRVFPLSKSIAPGKKKPSTFLIRRDSTAPEQHLVPGHFIWKLFNTQ